MTLTKALSINGQTVAFQLTSIGTPDKPELAYTLLSGHMDKAPVAEKMMFETVSRLYKQGQEVTAEDVRQLADRYSPYQGYWAHYLRIAS